MYYIEKRYEVTLENAGEKLKILIENFLRIGKLSKLQNAIEASKMKLMKLR